MASDGSAPDPGLVLREWIQLRFDGNVTALARQLAGEGASREEVDQWRNYVNRWKRPRDHPGRHDPSPDHLPKLAAALGEPVEVLHLLYGQDAVRRELQLVEDRVNSLIQRLGAQ